MNNSAIIKAENIRKVFKDGLKEVVALDGITFSIKKGEYLAIAGPSGAGKSTLIHILGGLDFPTQGKVFFEGKDISSLGNKETFILRNKKVGFMFQFYHLISELTVLENVLLPCLFATKSYKISKKKAQEICDKLGLVEKLDSYPQQLSGGQQQRVALARALINQPSVLFCDEPTGNLDHNSSEKIRNLLKSLNKNDSTTILSGEFCT